MKILVTGSNGFIGSHLVKKLIELGYEIVRYNPELIIHLAATTNIGTEFNPLIFDNNIVYANEVMKNKCRVIYASSCSAKYLTNPYAYSKRYIEYLGEKHGNAVGLRFHNVYGNGNNKGIIKYLLDAKNESDIIVRGANTVRDYIYVDDVVNAIIYYMDKDAGVYDIGTGIGTKTIDLVNMFMELSGKKFNLTEMEAGNNEPDVMISNNVVSYLSLTQGLSKTIQIENTNTGIK